MSRGSRGILNGSYLLVKYETFDLLNSNAIQTKSTKKTEKIK